MPLHILSTCAHHQEVKIVLHGLWYHHTYRWPSRAQVLSQPVRRTATYRYDDTRGRVMQFWPPDDEHMCLKHVETWNKLILKQKFCASSWLITKINILLVLFHNISLHFSVVSDAPFHLESGQCCYNTQDEPGAVNLPWLSIQSWSLLCLKTTVLRETMVYSGG